MLRGNWRGIYLDPSGLRVLVVGGGSVGARRAKWFASAGARVTVVAKEFKQELEDLARDGKIITVKLDIKNNEKKLLEYIENSDIVVIAVGGELAHWVASLSLSKGKLVNNAANSGEGNVIVPFQGVTSYGLNVSVTSLGETGVAARILLARILEFVEAPWARALYESMKCYKMILKNKINNIDIRMELYFLPEKDEEYWKHVENGDWRAALQRALDLAGLGDVDYPFCDTPGTGSENRVSNHHGAK